MDRLFVMTVAMWIGIGAGELPVSTSLPAQITMEDGSPYYVPVVATVVSGTPIRWENPTPTHHTVTYNGCVEEGGSCLFDSGAVQPGSDFVLSGLPAGRYAYHCRIHPIMRGQLTVTDDPSTPAHL